MEQISIFDSHPLIQQISTIDDLYAFIVGNTAWAEDAAIIAEVKIERQFTVQNDDTDNTDNTDTEENFEFSKACSMNIIKTGASLFFFGKKFASVCITKDGSLRLEIDANTLPLKPSWCDKFSIRHRKIKDNEFDIVWAETIYPTDEFVRFLQDTKLAYFRKLKPHFIGCCSHFNECSDRKCCVKPHWLLSVRCYYRQNLNNGKIFYGKNRNT